MSNSLVSVPGRGISFDQSHLGETFPLIKWPELIEVISAGRNFSQYDSL